MEYKTLKQNGVIAETEAEFVPKKFDTNYYKLSFKTLDGQTISESGKCGSKDRFDSYYSNIQVIYNPDNPKLYFLKPNFDNYSLTFKIFFFFGPYGIIGTLVAYGFLSAANRFRDKNFRNQIKKTLHNNGEHEEPR